MTTAAEVMRAYKLLNLVRADQILSDENRQWTADEAQFWLYWAQTELDPNCDWTMCLIKRQVTLVCACDRYEQAKVAVSAFLADQNPTLEQSDIEMIIEVVRDELGLQIEDLETAFSWGGDTVLYCTVQWSLETGGVVVQLPSDLRDDPVAIAKL